MASVLTWNGSPLWNPNYATARRTILNNQVGHQTVVQLSSTPPGLLAFVCHIAYIFIFQISKIIVHFVIIFTVRTQNWKKKRSGRLIHTSRAMSLYRPLGRTVRKRNHSNYRPHPVSSVASANINLSCKLFPSPTPISHRAGASSNKVSSSSFILKMLLSSTLT